MSDTHEWKSFFNDHAPLYMSNVFVKATLAEVDFIIDLLQLKPDVTILDVGCGTGRHSIELARRGYKMTGLDLSPGMLAEAKKAATEAGVQVEWIEADATRFEMERKYDVVLCLCEGSFGLLNISDDPAKHELSILRSINRALKPRGRFILTALNALKMIRQFSKEDIARGLFDPLEIIETHAMELESGGEIMVRERGFTAAQLRLMLEMTGFSVEHTWGGTAGNWGHRQLDPDEFELMVVSRKSGQPS